jgi:hypothetical protein
LRPMPHQNRVDPWGRLVASPARGAWFGNRGVLHDDAGQIRRQRVSEKRWIICVLEFKGRQRQLLTPGHYTELFFLDEVTALAAGHRPCAECRRPRYEAFRGAWAAAASGGASKPAAGEMDSQLDPERLRTDGTRPTFREVCGALPDGTFVTTGSQDDPSFEVVWGSQLWTWRVDGYAGSRRLDPLEEVAVVTPRSTVAALAAGYDAQCAVQVDR